VEAEENRDLQAEAEQRLVEGEESLRPFRLAWIALDDERAHALAGDAALARDRHRLLAERRYRPYTLSEPEERALAARAPAAEGAWQALFQQVTATLTAEFDGGDGPRPHTVPELLAYVHRPERGLRQGALETLYGALEPHAPTLAHCYDSLVADRLALDRVRGYPDPMLPTHLANELPAAAVDGMLDAVSAEYGLARRWFRAKAGALGLDRLELWDQYAPLGVQPAVDWDRARAMVEEAFGRFHPRLAEIVAGFFAEARIDVFPRVGKRGGAFCARVAQDASPYVLLNYTGQMRDALTLAHELGHGSHFTLAGERQSPHSFDTGIALAEVPSTFAEYLAYDLLLEEERDPQARLGLLAARVEGAFASVFRQTVLARYEQAAYALRAGRSRPTAWRPPGTRRTPPSTTTPSACPTGTVSAGPTSRTSSPRGSTPTPTPSPSWSRSCSTAATAPPAEGLPTGTWRCSPPAAPTPPTRSSPRSASTSATPGCGPTASPPWATW
jgi:oligoendopeptidase F